MALFALGAFAEDRYLVKVTGDVNAIAHISLQLQGE